MRIDGRTIRTLILSAALSLLAAPTMAQTALLSFDRAAYLTCRDVQSMSPEMRKTVATYLAEHVARHRGVKIPEGERGAQLAYLVRGGCTLSPDAYLFAVIDRVVVAEREKLPKR